MPLCHPDTEHVFFGSFWVCGGTFLNRILNGAFENA